MAELANARHERFAREYIRDANQTQAAIRAGYSKKSAKEQAVRLLMNESLYRRVTELKTAQFKRLQMGADEVLAGLANVARFDARKLFNEDGSFKGVTAIDDQTALAIAGIEIEETIQVADSDGAEVIKTRTTKIKANDRVKALGLLAKHLRLIEPDKNTDMPDVRMEILLAVAAMSRDKLLEFIAGKIDITPQRKVLIDQKPDP